MFGRAAAGFAAAVFAVGCGASHRESNTRLFALADVYEHNGDFEASALVRVDPRTLQPLARRGLPLHDAVTSHVLGPDGRTIAFGGTNDGELLFVDLAHPKRARRTIVARPKNDTPFLVEALAWPRPSLLVAITTLDGAWWGPHPSRLLIVDPQRRRVLRGVSLHETEAASADVAGRAVVLATRGRAASIVVVERDATIWRRRLPLDLGGPRVRVSGLRYPPEREPALATDGRSRVFVVAADRPVTEVRLDTRRVLDHSVSITRRYLAKPPPMTPGTGGVHLRYMSGATWLGHDELAVSGFDELPQGMRGGIGHTFAQRELAIVDTRTWTTKRMLRVGGCEPLRSVRLCNASVSGFAPDGKGSRGATLVTYDRRWRVLYRRRDDWWGVVAGRLVAGRADGSRMFLLDARSGRAIRRIRPSPVANQMWPLELFRWRPRAEGNQR